MPGAIAKAIEEIKKAAREQTVIGLKLKDDQPASRGFIQLFDKAKIRAQIQIYELRKARRERRRLRPDAIEDNNGN